MRYQYKDSNSACTFLVHEGQITNIRPNIDLNRFHSANMQIKRVLLTASENMSRHEISPGVLKTIDFLRGFESRAKARRGADAPNAEQLADATQLLNQVNEVFIQLVGKGSVAQINRIAARISPVKQPIQFLDECKSLIEITLNREVADEIFKPIYNNVRQTK